MIPENGEMVNVEVIKLPTYTYRLDFNTGRIIKYTDGLEAMEQFVYKALQTDRYRHEIYDWRYGFEIDDLIGKPVTLAKAKLPGRITDALIHDDRVIELGDFTFPQPVTNAYSSKRNTVVIQFSVNTIFGELGIKKGFEL